MCSSADRWVFNRGTADRLDLFKVIGDTVDGTFYITDCKQVPLRGGQLGAYTVESGLFSTEGGGRWAQFFHLRRPPCEPGSQAPHLHMYRCLTLPPDVAELIKGQTFLHPFTGRSGRSEPRWAAKGDHDSWEGWVWSNGDGWMWTMDRGWWKLIKPHGDHF